MVIGLVLLLLGIGWASQGAGIIGGSSLMDNNPTFIYLGALLALAGAGLVALGAISKPKAQPTAAM